MLLDVLLFHVDVDVAAVVACWRISVLLCVRYVDGVNCVEEVMHVLVHLLQRLAVANLLPCGSCNIPMVEPVCSDLDVRRSAPGSTSSTLSKKALDDTHSV